MDPINSVISCNLSMECQAISINHTRVVAWCGILLENCWYSGLWRSLCNGLCGIVCFVIRCGVVWCNVLWCSVIWLWYSMVWFGLVWYGIGTFNFQFSISHTVLPYCTIRYGITRHCKCDIACNTGTEWCEYVTLSEIYRAFIGLLFFLVVHCFRIWKPEKG